MRDDDNHTDDQHHYHTRRIADIIDRWRRDEITLTEKRKLIAEENTSYYRGEYRSPVTGEKITQRPRHYSGAAEVVADAAGVPPDAAASALAAARRANWTAAHHADSVSEARETCEAGRRAYADVMTSARATLPGMERRT